MAKGIYLNRIAKALFTRLTFGAVLFLCLQVHAQRLNKNIVYPLGSFSLDSTTEWLDVTFEDKIPGKVQLIGLGEVTHGGHEIPQVKAKMVQFLVEKKGVRTFLFEYPNATLSLLNYYLRENKLTSDDTLKRISVYAFSNALFDKALQDLLVWIKHYNLSHPTDMITFKGVDIKGASGSFSNYFRNNFFSLLDSTTKRKIDSEWNKTSIDTVTMELIRWYYGHKDFVQAKLESHYADFLYNVKNAEVDIVNEEMQRTNFYESLSHRDSMMAKNVEALCAGTTVFWAHNWHVASADRMGNAGAILKKDLGDRYYVIATDFSEKATVFTEKDTAMIEKSFLPDKKALGYRLYQKFNIGEGIVFYNDLPKTPRLPLLLTSIDIFGNHQLFGHGQSFDALVILRTITPTKFN